MTNQNGYCCDFHLCRVNFLHHHHRLGFVLVLILKFLSNRHCICCTATEITLKDELSSSLWRRKNFPICFSPFSCMQSSSPAGFWFGFWNLFFFCWHFFVGFDLFFPITSEYKRQSRRNTAPNHKFQPEKIPLSYKMTTWTT